MERKRSSRIVFLALVLALGILGTAQAGPATRVQSAIWAHGELYDTVVTDTSFVAPPEHSTDIIYSFMMSGLSGQRSIAEAAPGDPDFNGGRWNVYMAVFTSAGVAAHDEDSDGIVDFEVTSLDALLYHISLGHVEVHPANFYFECPMLPRRGR